MDRGKGGSGRFAQGKTETGPERSKFEDPSLNTKGGSTLFSTLINSINLVRCDDTRLDISTESILVFPDPSRIHGKTDRFENVGYID